MDMNQIPNEQLVYEILKENIVEPGRCVCNPQVTPETGFPEGEPVNSVFYGGVGHKAAGGEMMFGFVIFILAPIIATWLLSQTSENILSSYARKVMFFTGVGLLFALYGDLTSFGIGGDYPLSDAFIFAIHNIVLWTVIGLVVAWAVSFGRRRNASSWYIRNTWMQMSPMKLSKLFVRMCSMARKSSKS